jgi:HAE1 family hydrophobic/amphiphilic exporter-1
VIGGVVTSTLLTLLVIPTVYEILADSRDWLGARLRSSNKQMREPGHAGA